MRSGFGYIPPLGRTTSTLLETTTMEPSALQGKRTAGRPGTLDNPEVLKDVPGRIIPILEREFEDFETEATKFLDGETPENDFIGFRLKQGVYGQRQPGVQMIRIKLPFGGITPEQMEAFADVIERYVPLNKGHITTRQNIQLHHVPLKDATDVLRGLAPSGLSSREGCGNTVRNVTGDPWARAARTACATCPPPPGPGSSRASCAPRRRTPAPTSATSCATRPRSS